MVERRGLSQPGMRRFLVDRRTCPDAGGSNEPETHPNIEEPHEAPGHPEPEPTMDNFTSEFDPNEIECDPALRKQIYEYAPEIQDQVRRAYILKGPSQPTNILKDPGSRGFSLGWYKKYNWLEYSESKDAGYDVFNKTGWRDWKHAYKALPEHVGGVGSAHNKCVQKYGDFKNQRQSVQRVLKRASKQSEELYQTRLTSTLRCSRYLLKQGVAFRGHDESSSSLNKGNLRELIDFLKDNNEEVRNAYDRGGLNCKMTSPDIQKDLARCCAEEITEAIMEEIGNRPFSVLIDESRDISVKKQMAVILRYVNSKGIVVERFLALVHVKETTADALKEALLAVLDRNKLSVSRIRGQGYDGASNMRGEFNGLRRIENWRGIYRKWSIETGEVSTGRGLNQETILARPGDTRWGSHHVTLVRLSQMWDSVIKVLQIVHEDGRVPNQAAGLIQKMECFEFVFIMVLMLKVLGITNELSRALQTKGLNIVNALELIHDVKAQFNTMRESGWDNLFDEARQFCDLNGIPIPKMSEEIPVRGRSRHDGITVTNLHHYRVGIFYVVLDKICAEMNHRFTEATMELLMCFSCLDPKNSFSSFDVNSRARLAEIYAEDFSNHDRGVIRGQLETYILHVRRHAAFANCKDIESLSQKMVETEKHLLFPLVYKLIELALLVPVSAATVERAFSCMKTMKSKSRNRIADDWFNNFMICYIERNYSIHLMKLLLFGGFKT